MRLEVKPETYWQVDAVAPGRNTPTVTGTFPAIGPSGMAQSILGLPLMNNYYVVFDRSDSKGKNAGLIRFAKPNPAGYPT